MSGVCPGLGRYVRGTGGCRAALPLAAVSCGLAIAVGGCGGDGEQATAPTEPRTTITDAREAAVAALGRQGAEPKPGQALP